MLFHQHPNGIDDILVAQSRRGVELFNPGEEIVLESCDDLCRSHELLALIHFLWWDRDGHSQSHHAEPKAGNLLRIFLVLFKYINERSAQLSNIEDAIRDILLQIREGGIVLMSSCQLDELSPCCCRCQGTLAAQRHYFLEHLHLDPLFPRAVESDGFNSHSKKIDAFGLLHGCNLLSVRSACTASILRLAIAFITIDKSDATWYGSTLSFWA